MCKIDHYTLWRSYMKKFALILIASILAISLVACANEDVEDDNSGSVSDYLQSSHEHKIYDDDGKTVLGTLTFEDGVGDTAIISDYVGVHTGHVVTIPTTVGPAEAERKVTAIGKEAFYYCTSITSVVIPEGVTSIGDYAFAGCTGLQTIIITASVTSIGKGAFNGCSSLTTIKFAEGSKLTSIADYAFDKCTSLTSITLPEGLETIGTVAFRDCSALTSVVTPSSLKSIGDMAFFNCQGLNKAGALDLSASVNVTVTIETVVDEATGDETEVEIIAIGEFAFGGINKNYIKVPADPNTGVAKYVAAMGGSDEAASPELSDE